MIDKDIEKIKTAADKMKEIFKDLDKSVKCYIDSMDVVGGGVVAKLTMIIDKDT